jgi:copper oxidase (laccase) domain-containing protein
MLDTRTGTLEQLDAISVYTNDTVEIAYSGVALGNVAQTFGDPEEAASNLARLRAAISVGSYALIRSRHENSFIDLSSAAAEDVAPIYFTDGLFTDSPDIVLGMNPADCNAMVYYSAGGDSVIGLIHGGTKSVADDIHLAALDHLVKTHGVTIDDVRIFFAPSIRKQSYFFDRLPPEQLADRKWSRHIDSTNGLYYVDVLSRIICDLTDQGVEPEQLDVTPIDTGSDPAYFSHARAVRNEEPEGRNGLVAKLRY